MNQRILESLVSSEKNTEWEKRELRHVISQSLTIGDPCSLQARVLGTAGKSRGQTGVDALVRAATDYNEPAPEEMFGIDGTDLILTGDGRDRKPASDFTREAGEEMKVCLGPEERRSAPSCCLKENWSFFLALVKTWPQNGSPADASAAHGFSTACRRPESE